jgi:acetylornithine deacetylase/succinyl-diaminopimelate desuccinylase-like protein
VILASPERIEAVRAAARAATDEVLDLTAQIAAVASPTGSERAKADFVQLLFEREGLSTHRDHLDNVVARIPGQLAMTLGRKTLLIAAHLDTVFPVDTPLDVRRNGDRLWGPGIGDNSVAVATVIKLASLLKVAGETLAVDVLVTGNVGEEGLGNLRGIKEVMARHVDVGAMMALEGHNLGRVTHVAVGSRRFRVIAEGAGGHSWGDFGRPSAITAMARFITEIDAIPLPRAPKTTLNVGVLEGGVSINTIAPRATCLVDLRSTDELALQRLTERLMRTVSKSNRNGSVRLSLEAIGERPAGVVPVESPIVHLAAKALTTLGLEPSFDASSTDANVPIAAGIPAVCIGLTTGGNVHRTDEYIDLPPVALGIAQFALVTVALTESLADGNL